MADIKVTSEELRNVSGQLATGSASVSEQLESMKRQVDALVSSNWQGAASASFNATVCSYIMCANYSTFIYYVC